MLCVLKYKCFSRAEGRGTKKKRKNIKIYVGSKRGEINFDFYYGGKTGNKIK